MTVVLQTMIPGNRTTCCI